MTRDEKVFTIQEISRALDIPKSTLRYWEKAIPQIVPRRTDGGQRRYTRAHIRVFERVIELKRQGVGLARIQKTLARAAAPEPALLSSRQFEQLTRRIVETVQNELRNYLHGLAPDEPGTQTRVKKSSIPNTREFGK